MSKKKNKALESLGEEKRMVVEFFRRKGRQYEKLAKKTINSFIEFNIVNDEHKPEDRNGLLCATFLNLHTNTTIESSPSLEVLKNNLIYTKPYCKSWIILSYGCYSESDEILMKKKLVDDLNIDPNKDRIYHVLCAKSIGYDYDFSSSISSSKSMLDKATMHIPKTLLYKELLPYMYDYERVWLIDEDIDFENFNYESFFHILNCSFWPLSPPLIVQSTINPRTQRYDFLNTYKWMNTTTVALASEFVELQAPLMDTMFFIWFVKNIIEPLELPMKALESLWGVDELFCKSSSFYSDSLKHYTNQSHGTACMIVTSPECSLKHHNLHTIKKSPKFRTQGFVLQSLIRRAFPTFARSGFKQNKKSSTFLSHPRLNSWLHITSDDLHCS